MKTVFAYLTSKVNYTIHP